MHIIACRKDFFANRKVIILLFILAGLVVMILMAVLSTTGCCGCCSVFVDGFYDGYYGY